MIPETGDASGCRGFFLTHSDPNAWHFALLFCSITLQCQSSQNDLINPGQLDFFFKGMTAFGACHARKTYPIVTQHRYSLILRTWRRKWHLFASRRVSALKQNSSFCCEFSLVKPIPKYPFPSGLSKDADKSSYSRAAYRYSQLPASLDDAPSVQSQA